MRKLVLILAIIIGLIGPVVPARAADFLLLDAVATSPVTSAEIPLINQRSKKSYWVYITGTANVEIDVAPRTGAAFIPLVTGITTSILVDTVAPAQRTQVRVTSCSGCTVTVLLQVDL